MNLIGAVADDDFNTSADPINVTTISLSLLLLFGLLLLALVLLLSLSYL